MIHQLPSLPRSAISVVCGIVATLIVLASCSGAVSSPPKSTNVSDGADLAAAAPSVSDDSPSAGGKATLSVTVRNVGATASPATTLRYYRSPDATITTSDTPVGTAEVAALPASRSTVESVELTAPAAPGIYYYGGCVDAVAGEADTTNNCSGGARVTVQTIALTGAEQEDLAVTTPLVSDSSPAGGSGFTLSVTVRNAGGAAGEATTLRYYRSTDATITASDTEIGTEAVAALAAAGGGSHSVDLTAPTTPGTYYYGACVDATAGEADTTNNCSASVPITVPEPQRPDLAVMSPSVSHGRPVTGTGFTLSATVSNDGDRGASASTLRYYRSTDATITASDAPVGTNVVAELAAAGSSSHSVHLTAPGTPGTYYYGACVEAVADESDTTNNCSESVEVVVQNAVTEPTGQPDLTVTDESVSDRRPITGTSFTLSATVRNGGDGAAAATTLHYYRSSDATITTADTQVGTDAVGALGAAGSSAASIVLTAPATAGAYYYGACVDAVTAESDRADNCSSSVRVDVEEPKRPDLRVETPGADDTSPETGATITLSATVTNAGDARSPATTLRYYRSTDATITTADTQAGTDDVGALAASGSSAESISLTVPTTAGAYYYGACVDAVTDESDTTDNCSASVTVDVEEPTYPDLQVGTPTVNNSSPETGATFTLSATVSNTDDGESPATTLRYYRSTDATITTSDTPAGMDIVGVLAGSASSDQSVDLTAPDTAGTYYYGACVDAVTGESDTTNNCSASATVTVAEARQSGATVEITAEDDKEWAPVGDEVDLSVLVLDDGGEEITDASVSWSSSDTSVATVDSSGVMTAVGVGTATLTATLSGSATQSVAPRLRVSSGAVVKAEEPVAGSIEMVVVERASRVEVSPDSLSFDSVGQIITLTATVYDQNGTVMEPRYLVWSSNDTNVVSVPQWYEGSVRAIAEGITTVSVTANASATGTAAVTVTLPTARVTAAPNSLTFESLGVSKSVTIKAFDENGDEDEDATITWSVDETPDLTGVPAGTQDIFVITVENETGGLKVTAEGNGSASVTVSSGDLESALFLVNVSQKAASIELAPSSESLSVDGTATLSATVKDANGHSIPIHNGATSGLVVVSWTTSNSGVAKVIGSNYSTTTSSGETRIDNEGVTATVTAITAGTATITGRTGEFSATATITVTE